MNDRAALRSVAAVVVILFVLSATASAQQLVDESKLRIGTGAPPQFPVDPGWKVDRFPDHAVCYRTPTEIKELYARTVRNRNERAVVSYPQPTDGSLRIVATGHSFVARCYQLLPHVAHAGGFSQQKPIHKNVGGGQSGSARTKWELENGIFRYEGKPLPKLLASISNAKWDVMLWGPYYHDRPEYYTCWIDFCLKYNPNMTFYLMDAWPQIRQLPERPKSEDEFTHHVIAEMGRVKRDVYIELINGLNKKYPGRLHIVPTCDAMVLAAQHLLHGKLPGIEGIHKLVGRKERSIWRDEIGHLGPDMTVLEAYVYYGTLYGMSPELITGENPIAARPELDAVFRRIAWQAVINHPLSGVKDVDRDGLADH